ncbi:hypothetical protein ACFSX6_08995 [Hymenobacter rubripertinctus]
MKTSAFKLLLFLCAGVISCSSDNDALQESFVNPHITKYVKGYIKATQLEYTPGISDSLEFITVSIEDSLVSIASAEPDFERTKMVGAERIDGIPIYFIGTPNPQLYKPGKQTLKIPLQPKQVQRAGAPPPPPPPGFNFELWQLVFRDGELISYSPKDRIDKYTR